MRALRVVAIFLAGCGGATALDGPDDESPSDSGASPDAEAPLVPGHSCETCDGEVDITKGPGHYERPDGGTLELTLQLENCGRGTAPAGVRLVLRGRDESGVIEVLDEAATTRPLPSHMGQSVTLTAPWERWSRYINRQDLCLEMVLEAGDIEDCSYTGDWAWSREDIDGCCHCLDAEE